MKQIIRLTESDLHKMVKETVKSILESQIPKELGNYVSDAIIEYPDGKLKVLMKKMRLATPKDSFSGLY